MRTGKIARLPQSIRDEVNFGLQNGVPAVTLLRWLNAQPDVQFVMQQNFGGRAIAPWNMTEWIKGGYREWLMRQEMFEAAIAARANQQQRLTPPGSPENPPTPPQNWTKLDVAAGSNPNLVQRENSNQTENKPEPAKNLCNDLFTPI